MNLPRHAVPLLLINLTVLPIVDFLLNTGALTALPLYLFLTRTQLVVFAVVTAWCPLRLPIRLLVLLVGSIALSSFTACTELLVIVGEVKLQSVIGLMFNYSMIYHFPILVAASVLIALRQLTATIAGKVANYSLADTFLVTAFFAVTISWFKVILSSRAGDFWIKDIVPVSQALKGTAFLGLSAGSLAIAACAQFPAAFFGIAGLLLLQLLMPEFVPGWQGTALVQAGYLLLTVVVPCQALRLREDRMAIAT